jgi:ribonucleotide reductase beta subunit family protein with ferritin-like domain
VIPHFPCDTSCLGIILLCCFLVSIHHDREDRDEDCVSNKELCDFMKAMTKLLTKNQASTTTASHSTISYCILPSLPFYDGFDSNKYFTWEIEMDKKIYNAGESLEMLLVL